jgi:hypothetical protein
VREWPKKSEFDRDRLVTMVKHIVRFVKRRLTMSLNEISHVASRTTIVCT